MSQYNILNVTFSNSQLNKLKLRTKKGTEVTLKLSSNDVSDSNDGNNFPRKLLLTYTQVSRLHKAFQNGSSANITLSKIQLHKIGESGGFLGRLLGRLLKTGFSLMKNVFKPSAESVFNAIRINSTSISSRCSYSSENVWIWHDDMHTF